MADDSNVAVWDTCVLIHAIEKCGERWTEIEPYLRDAERGGAEVCPGEQVSLIHGQTTQSHRRYLGQIRAAAGLTRP